MKKILLYSGGMDSWLIKKLWHPDICLYINMHTSYGSEELKRQQAGDNDLMEFPLQRWERADKIIPNRNLLLCIAAANEYQSDDIQICLGATKGDRVLDKSKKFARMTTRLLSFLWQKQWWTKGRKIEVVVPYKDWTKEDLLREYKRRGGDLEVAWKESFSCYHPDEFGCECWECKPCVRKAVAFWAVGARFITSNNTNTKKVLRVLNEEIVPQIKAGKYGRGKREEEEILKVWREMEWVINRRIV